MSENQETPVPDKRLFLSFDPQTSSQLYASCFGYLTGIVDGYFNGHITRGAFRAEFNGLQRYVAQMMEEFISTYNRKNLNAMTLAEFNGLQETTSDEACAKDGRKSVTLDYDGEPK